jgi:predicted nucleic acid-binding protein
MHSMTPVAWRLRAAALLGAGSLAVHQLRYMAGYGQDPASALSQQGHAYLSALTPLLTAVLVLAVGEIVHRLARRGGGAAVDRPRSLSRLWAGSTVCLALMYAAQEWAEGQLAAGHPAGVAGVLGHGGWTALAFAALVALAISVALRGAAAALATRPAGRAPHARARRTTAVRFAPPAPRAPLDAVARHLAGRGPPLPSG